MVLMPSRRQGSQAVGVPDGGPSGPTFGSSSTVVLLVARTIAPLVLINPITVLPPSMQEVTDRNACGYGNPRVSAFFLLAPQAEDSRIHQARRFNSSDRGHQCTLTRHQCVRPSRDHPTPRSQASPLALVPPLTPRSSRYLQNGKGNSADNGQRYSRQEIERNQRFLSLCKKSVAIKNPL
ncbi:hypothetical protein PVK06_010391 [Gossypium arboreum]|uniref:Uncharacterized protein n=1 Tax=Gossypium arboreum TaxID=29729 RepID=A0ABR0Q5U6_GOSAR|nr:hypothetical protein PVK06_010391 [Gossypium arboreum]